MFRKMLFAGAVMALFVPGARADESTVYDWSGFYAGIHAGYGWGTSDATEDTDLNYSYNMPRDNWDYDIDGFLAGGQLGVNFQKDTVLFGLEGDIGFLGVKGDKPSHGTNASDDTFSSVDGDFYMTATGRLGYATDRILLYIKGGFALADLNTAIDDETTDDAFIHAKDDGIQPGLAAGGGIEWAINDQISLKLEYLYLAFSNIKTTGTPYLLNIQTGEPDPFPDVTWKHDVDIHTLKAGINYHF